MSLPAPVANWRILPTSSLGGYGAAWSLLLMADLLYHMVRRAALGESRKLTEDQSNSLRYRAAGFSAPGLGAASWAQGSEMPEPETCSSCLSSFPVLD
jgi:hypothetical protein